jgi:hypothetical protein
MAPPNISGEMNPEAEKTVVAGSDGMIADWKKNRVFLDPV